MAITNADLKPKLYKIPYKFSYIYDDTGQIIFLNFNYSTEYSRKLLGTYFANRIAYLYTHNDFIEGWLYY